MTSLPARAIRETPQSKRPTAGKSATGRPAVSLVTESSKPAPRQPQRSRPRSKSAPDAKVLEYFPDIRKLCEEDITEEFDSHPAGTAIPCQSVFPLGRLVLESKSSQGLEINDTQGRRALTSKQGRPVDCCLWFPRSYRRVLLKVSVNHTTARTHIGFINHANSQELKTLDFGGDSHPQQGRNTVMWLNFEFEAPPLNEVIGITWRGGSISIDSISLKC